MPVLMTAPPIAPPKRPRPADPEALMKEARERQRRRRLRLALAVLLLGGSGGIGYSIDRGIIAGHSAPACATSACIGAAVSENSSAASNARLYGFTQSFLNSSTLEWLNPNTLEQFGKTVELPMGLIPGALSPDGKHLLVVRRPFPRNRHVLGVGIVDLQSMSLVKRAQSQLIVDLGQNTAVANSWPTANRIILVTQRFSEPYSRNVVGRTLLVVDPTTGKVIWKRPLTNKLALGGAGTVGHRLLFVSFLRIDRGSAS